MICNRKTIIIIAILSLIYAALVSYMGFDHNSGVEYCAYVSEGDSYHLRLEELPCRITPTALFETALAFFVAALALGIPVGVACLFRRGRKP